MTAEEFLTALSRDQSAEERLARVIARDRLLIAEARKGMHELLDKADISAYQRERTKWGVDILCNALAPAAPGGK